MAKRVRPGDVLETEVPASRAFLYLCHLGTHPEYGDVVEVCPAEQSSRPDDLDGLFKSGSGYVVFYPATAAVAGGLATVVGRTTRKGVPKAIRRPGARVGTAVKTWIVEDDRGERVRQKLSSDELHLPIAVIWNHALLLQRVQEGWRPETEGA